MICLAYFPTVSIAAQNFLISRSLHKNLKFQAGSHLEQYCVWNRIFGFSALRRAFMLSQLHIKTNLEVLLCQSVLIPLLGEDKRGISLKLFPKLFVLLTISARTRMALTVKSRRYEMCSFQSLTLRVLPQLGKQPINSRTMASLIPDKILASERLVASILQSHPKLLLDSWSDRLLIGPIIWYNASSEWLHIIHIEILSKACDRYE
jgi:hypothetical protein